MLHQASPARERLLDGFLRRLAAAPEAEAFALRGGMLVRAWLPDAGRAIRDADLVCSLPYRPRDLRIRLRDMLARCVDDGVIFDADRFRVDRVWPDSAQPGLKLFARGVTGGAVAEMTVDITFQLAVWPAAVRRVVGGAQLWTCSHEMVLGTKLRVIAELGPREWRPKDLADIWLVLRRFPPASFRVLGEAIERCFARGRDARELFRTSWWREREAASRWSRFVARQPAVPADLDGVVADVHARLSPFARTP